MWRLMTQYREPGNEESLDDTRSPMDRRRFLALCTAGASTLLFGAACGIGGEDGGEDENEGDGENEGGGEDGGEDEDEENEEEED